MKRLIAITGAILIGCTIVSAAASSESKLSETTQTIYNETENPSKSEQNDFIIRLVNENVVVFLSDGMTVYLDTGKNVSSLPQGDKLRLEQGIEVHGRDNLKRLLEDYCS